MKHFFFVLCMLFTVGVPKSTCAQQYIVVSFSEATLTVYEDEKAILQTPVVLPRGNYYSLPRYGTVSAAIMGPSWRPTPRMIATGKYRKYYGPHSNGNAMGHCKISIDFDRSSRVLQYVRIHGNAKQEDLGRRKSSGCIRMPDNFCSSIVSILSSENVRVSFIP